MSDLTAVSLFAGVGGFDKALEGAGIRTVAAVEIDPDCRGVLRRHFPGTAIFSDVREVTGEQLRAAGFVPGRGVLSFGWPCQGNSVAGRGKGMADPRSGLWVHVARLLAELRPRWLLGENVPGLLSVNGGRDFGTVIRNLDELGYGMAWRILDAQFFGVPQRRRRVFLAGCLGDPAGPVEVLLEPESGEGNPAAGRQAGTRIAGTLAASAGGGGLGGAGQSVSSITSRLVETASTLQGGGRRGHRVDAEGAAGGHLVLDVADTLRSHPRPGSNTTGAVVPVALRGRDGGSQAECGEPGDPAFTVRTPGGGSSYPMVAHALTSEGADASEDGTGRGTPLVTVPVAATLTSGTAAGDGVREPWFTLARTTQKNLVASPMAFNPQSGGSKARLGWGDKPTALQASRVSAVAVGVAENQRGEVVESAVSHQLTTGRRKAPPARLAAQSLPDCAVRRLRPRMECERLQGFPDDWTRWQDDGTEQSDSARYRQLGNAVAVPVVQWIAERLAAVESAAEAGEVA